MNIPKFTYTKSLPGALTQGEFVHHNSRPMLAAKIIRKADGSIGIDLVRNPENAGNEVVGSIMNEMKGWFISARPDKQA